MLAFLIMKSDIFYVFLSLTGDKKEIYRQTYIHIYE